MCSRGLQTRGNVFHTESSVRQAIDEFERGSLSCEQWNQELRLTVTMWYLMTLDEAEATARLIAGMRAIARLHDGPDRMRYSYNETITVFWMAVARQFSSSTVKKADRLHVLKRFVESYGDRENLILEHYTPHALHSWQAQWGWVEPDLRPLAVSPAKCGISGNTGENSDRAHGCTSGQS